MIAQTLSLSLSFPAISDWLQVTIDNQLHKKNYSSHHHHDGWRNGQQTSHNNTKECAAEKKLKDKHRFANSEP
jgi:hypothetical protein